MIRGILRLEFHTRVNYSDAFNYLHAFNILLITKIFIFAIFCFLSGTIFDTFGSSISDSQPFFALGLSMNNFQ